MPDGLGGDLGGFRPGARRSSEFECEIITTLEGIEALEPEWGSLYGAALSPSPPQGYAFVRTAWTVFGSERRFAVVTCRSHGRLVGLWPVSGVDGASRGRLQSVGFGDGEEYSGPLVEAAPTAAGATAALLRKLREFGCAIKTTVPAEHPLANLPLASYSHPVHSPAIGLREHASFDAWLNGKSGSFRKGLRYDRRKLAEEHTIALIDGRADLGLSHAIIDWQFHEKRRWLERRRLPPNWVTDDRSRILLNRLIAAGDAADTGVEPWALLVDDVPAAAAVCFVSPLTIELFMLVMNPDFSARSPGNLLIEDIARSAHARGRDFDFRINPDAYKMRWADRTIEYKTLVIALTPTGYPSLIRPKLRSWTMAARRFGRRRLTDLRSAFVRSKRAMVPASTDEGA